MTYTFTLQIDLHHGERPINPNRVARAVARVIDHAKESDIEGAEVLDSRWGQVTVQPTGGVIGRAK